MMDYVELVKHIKERYNAQDKAVIVFGGSYGGMLAAWLRMKFPSTFQGALAASAPILYFKGAPSAPEDEFSMIATRDFAETFPDERCSKGIKEAFNVLMDLKTRQDDWAEVSTLFNTCKVIDADTKIQNMYEHFSNGFLYMAMTDYPYPSAFLEPMPAWPVNVSCEAWTDIEPAVGPSLKGLGALSDREKLVLTALNTSANVYFNFENQTACLDTDDTEGTGTLDAAGWNVLACNELAMPTSMGADSMFIEDPFNYTTYTKFCQDTYGLTPNYQWALNQFGGFNVPRDFQAMSNIIFSNGELDPWRAGGVYEWVNLDLPFYIIRGGAHHLDLRLPNEVDKGTDVEFVREKEAILIEMWVKEYQTAASTVFTQ
jgi:lysosomal Pro-X carboxypeptidase